MLVPRPRLILFAGALVALGAAVPAVVAGTSATAATPTLDHFQCYVAQATQTAAAPTPFPGTPPAALLKNKFAPSGLVAAIGNVSMHCNPVQKTLPTGAVTPITNPRAHLVCWSIKGNPQTPLPPLTTFVNQFGKGALKATAAVGLCLPSWKNVSAPKFPTSTAPPGLDHFTCYAATNPAGTPQFTPPPVVTLKDQFFGYQTKLGPVNLMCAPTSKILNPAAGGTPVVNPQHYLVCFVTPATSAFAARTVYAKNQF
ncbi:MAG TPA: hypothetical protein VGI86_19640, partial [Acidimicrobiia bacterium]